MRLKSPTFRLRFPVIRPAVCVSSCSCLLALCLAGILLLPQQSIAQEANLERATYRVQPGDTLVGIAVRELGSVREVNTLLDLNPQIEDPNQIRVNQVLHLGASGRLAPTGSSKAAGQTGAGEALLEKGFVRVHEQMEVLGIAGISLAMLLVVSIGSSVAIHLFIGGLLLWLGTLLAKVENGGFWKSFGANFKGTLCSLVAALLLWGSCGVAFAFIDREALYQIEFPRLALAAFGVVASIGFLQFLVYVVSVRNSFSISLSRAFAACLLAAILQGTFAIVLTPVLSGAALGL